MNGNEANKTFTKLSDKEQPSIYPVGSLEVANA